MAAGMYAYQGAWIIPFLAAAAALHLLLDRLAEPARSHPQQWSASHRRSVPLPALTAMLLVLPLAWFFWQHPDLLLLRPTQLAIVGETGSPADSSLGGNVWASDQDVRARRRRPATSTRVAICPARRRSACGRRCPSTSVLSSPSFASADRPTPSRLLGLIGLLLPGVFSEYAPHFHRMLGAAAPVALLCGMGLDWLVAAGRRVRSDAAPASTRTQRRGQESCRRLRWSSRCSSRRRASSARDYFVRWAALPDLYYAFDEGLWELGQCDRTTCAAEMPVYITPQGADHATLAFAWRRAPGLGGHGRRSPSMAATSFR